MQNYELWNIWGLGNIFHAIRCKSSFIIVFKIIIIRRRRIDFWIDFFFVFNKKNPKQIYYIKIFINLWFFFSLKYKG